MKSLNFSGFFVIHIPDKSGKHPFFTIFFYRISTAEHLPQYGRCHTKAQRAAEQVALRRGWITAAQVRNNNIHQVNNDCMEIIRGMSSWSWMDYKAALIRKGYSILERRDSKNILRGYILQKGNARYKASELGVGRNLMASKLYQTWMKEHPESNQPQRMRESKSVTRPSVATLNINMEQFLIALPPMEMNIDSISLKRCLRCMMMNSTTDL